MTLETFFNKFDQFADAPDAVAKMRKLLIHFAVSGKLVPNDPREKPVALTLLGPSPDDVGLPLNWRSGLVGDAFTFEYGDNLPAPKRTETGEYPVYGSNGIVGTHDTYLTKEPAIIVGRKGSAGALNVADGPSWTTDVAYFVRLPKDLDLRFTYYLFSTLRLDELGKGIKPGLSRKEAYALPIALPPLAEQKRIVAKMDELMALCDRLATQQEERETRHSALARASLARFADAPTPANLNFIFHKFCAITPADLRKSILTLALQGKLVPQEPNDEPVEDLLARNDERRRETARSDHRADEENQPSLSGDDRWDIPDTWSWRGLADLVLFVDYRGKTPAKLSSGVRLLTAKNVRKGQINLSPEEFLSESEYHTWMTRGFPKVGDILFTTEAPMGNAAVVELTERFALAQRVICFQSYGALDPAFLVMQILSDQFQFILDKNGTGVTAKGIKASKLKQLPVAIPPLAEQCRIVAKMNQLMALVDELEAQLAASHVTAANLLSAVVAELTTQR
jgi:type I restriction enzyme, S subunit